MTSRPRTIAEAVSCLAATLSPNVLCMIRGSESCERGEWHFGVGLTVRNELLLWQPENPLLAACQTTCADEASVVILSALWRHLVDTATVEELAHARRMRRAHDDERACQRQALLDHQAAEDALITTSTCPHCAKPCPSYRRTCKHCGRSVRCSGDQA